jgi:hypothetical protein
MPGVPPAIVTRSASVISEVVSSSIIRCRAYRRVFEATILVTFIAGPAGQVLGRVLNFRALNIRQLVPTSIPSDVSRYLPTHFRAHQFGTGTAIR